MRIGREFQLLVSPCGSAAIEALRLRLDVRGRTRLAPTTSGIKPPPDSVGS